MLDGSVKLKVEEEAILNRWMVCDGFLKAKEFTEDEIIEKLVKTCEVSKFTARNDITYAQRLFADCRKINKRYLIHLHLERIDRDIENVRKKIIRSDSVDADGKLESYPVDAKELAALAKLHETYTYTLNSLPEEVKVETQPPPKFLFLLAPGQTIERSGLALEDVLKKSDAIEMQQRPDGVYQIPEEDEE